MTIKCHFSEPMQAVLVDSGWSRDRHVDAREFIRDWSDWFVCTPVVQEVLSSFLDVSVSDSTGNFMRFGECPEFHQVQEGDSERLGKLHGRPVFPIAGGGRFMFFMDAEGGVLAVHDEFTMYWQAPNLAAAMDIEFRFEGVKVVPIPDGLLDSHP